MDLFVLHLYNPESGDTTTLSSDHPSSIAYADILVLPGEFLQDLARLQAEWDADSPLKSRRLTILRTILLKADWQRRRVETAFECLQLSLSVVGIPMEKWDRRTQKQFNTLELQQTRARRAFNLALKNLQTAETAHQQTGKTAAAAVAKQDPPPAETPRGEDVVYYQTASISLLEGETVTTLDLDAAHWISRYPWPHAKGFCRQLCFQNGVVPETYAYALTHQGVTYEPCRTIFLFYSPEEFLRLCKLEMETGSLHLLDGARFAMERLE